MSEIQEKATFVSKHFHLMTLISQSIGISSAALAPISAIKYGPLGYVICNALTCILVGIPLLHMELIIGQYTGLNALEVWKVRPFLSHIGHILVLWQCLILYLNHVIATYVIHYFIISFEDPKPFYTCGPWADGNCDIVTTNFTINQDCIRSGPKFQYCEKLHLTFPETQYFKELIGRSSRVPVMEWRLCLPSGIACILLYLSCFKRRRSMKWFHGVLTFYPGFCFVLNMLGSMAQKGILIHYQEALDINFEKFLSKFNVFDLLSMTIYTISLGTGLVVNVGSSCPFRAPCYANAVYTMAANVAFHLVVVVTSAMLLCPYAFEHAMSPERASHIPLAHIFERLPCLLREYDNNSFWLIITFSSYACLALRTTVIIYYNLLEMFSKRFSIVEKFPGVVTFGVSFFLFCSTMPFYANILKIFLSRSFRVCIQLLTIVVVIVECLVFVLIYGLERFSEDVHFMQGVRPSNYVKLSWIVSSLILLYACLVEMYYLSTNGSSFERLLGIWLLGIAVTYLIGMAVVKVAVAACKRQARAALRLSAAWRPRSELLQRSRAMFTAQAMTKEYLYRQYHLQAGILARQRRANRTRVNIDNI